MGATQHTGGDGRNMISNFCDWLAATAVSQAFQNLAWFVPIVQTIHILAISFLAVALGALSLGLIAGRADQQDDQSEKIPPVFHTKEILTSRYLVPSRSFRSQRCKSDHC